MASEADDGSETAVSFFEASEEAASLEEAPLASVFFTSVLAVCKGKR